MGWTPTDLAAAVRCSRSRVYRTVRASRQGTLGWEHDETGQLGAPVRTTVWLPTRRRSLEARRNVRPQADGWCRARGRGATWALTRQTTPGVTVAAATLRRWRHALGWVWNRATLVANDDEPCRVARWAQIRWVFEPLQRAEALVCAEAREVHLWPTVGGAGMPTGSPVEVMTPGQQQTHDLAGALDLATGALQHGVGPRTTKALCRALRETLETSSPAER